MSKNSKPARPEARLPKGLQDVSPSEIRKTAQMVESIRQVFERYGFEPLETPAIEYTEALGKFLPDSDRPNEGVFSFQDEDEQWLSLRYDLTAPLARFVAANQQNLPRPYRRYQTGPVFRNEKPGPGRFRQFTQFDADTVGAPSVAADAELCMLAADTLEALGIARGDYLVKVNNRKVLDGVLDAAEVADEQRLTVLRAVDKYDRLGWDGVRQLLGEGRRDESGDYTKGAGLSDEQIRLVLDVVGGEAEAWVSYKKDAKLPTDDEQSVLGKDLFPHRPEGSEAWNDKFFPDQDALLRIWQDAVGNSERGLEGVAELSEMLQLFRSSGYGSRRIQLSSSIVRGLEYYTGPVFEAELIFEATDDKGRPVRFGSVGAGGRYDGLVERFTGQKVPATGFSVGVSRLRHALDLLGKSEGEGLLGPVVITVFDKERIADYQRMATELRQAGIRAEMYLGGSGMKAQMKYADKRGAPCVVIQGGDELEKGEITIKDLIEGARLSEEIEDNAEWREARPAQISVPESDLVSAVRDILARYGSA
ncbi:Histidine--tRNA ligase [Methyloligella halotolerans]|uniref:Histidine--tRNA ligase n=1 Tax=Methyloligella halotolerans TaxID=1177755 RepID=A0A1E2RYK8_9HYPH|nr:histidine--tRNA ligase [Methyloligella halotolerans]ODA67188.1 Histidine--tRNA ligase [Methyloligella halotolerans]